MRDRSEHLRERQRIGAHTLPDAILSQLERVPRHLQHATRQPVGRVAVRLHLVDAVGESVNLELDLCRMVLDKSSCRGEHVLVGGAGIGECGFRGAEEVLGIFGR